MLAPILVAGALAVSPSQHYSLLGPGSISCGTWLQQRKEDSFPAIASGDWVFGYLTAYNYYVAKDGDVTRNIDANGVLSWIDQYCQANPLNDLSQATLALLAELNARKR